LIEFAKATEAFVLSKYDYKTVGERKGIVKKPRVNQIVPKSRLARKGYFTPYDSVLCNSKS
jgi:hypothetical protein